MGLFGSIFGTDAAFGALNVVMANHIWGELSYSSKKAVAAEVIQIIWSTRRSQLGDQIIRELDSENRIVQMLFLSLALDNKGISALPGNSWMRPKNPYHLAEKISANHIDSAIKLIRKDCCIDVDWPSTGHYFGGVNFYELILGSNG